MAAKKSAKKATKITAKSAKPTPKKTAKPAAPKKAAKPATAKKKRPVQPGVLHWEIQANDAKKLHRFYGDLFGWKIDDGNPMKYGMVASKGKGGINGGIGGAPSGRSRVLVYAEVEDISATLEKAERLGAKTIMLRTDVGPVVMGIFEDLEGNHFGVIEG
jgi:predicted enzyme related to lactoylglutathione lyase